jgi:hypothetical protein
MEDAAIPSSSSSTNLATDDDTVSSGSSVLVLFVGVRGAVGRIIRVAAAGATAVKLDAVAGAGDAIAFAGAAAGRIGGDAGWARAVGAAGAGEGWHVRVGIGVRVGILVDVGIAEAGGELVNGGLVVALGDDVGGLDWVVWLWALDVLWSDTTAAGDLLRGAARGALGGGGLAAARWDIKDVKLALSGWLKDGLLGWVVGAVVAVHDVLL